MSYCFLRQGKPVALLETFVKWSFSHLRYCLDDRKALERDGGFSELQSRLIRYETQTTCTRESLPVPAVLSPLPSPAVLSESGSVPDGEALQSELRTEASRLKRRSKDLNCLPAPKRWETISTKTVFSQSSGLLFFILVFHIFQLLPEYAFDSSLLGNIFLLSSDFAYTLQK